MTGFFVDIRFLTTFLEVANTRHFGRAAENLYLTQSAVSARIKLLEEYFNTALFIRNRNSIQITQAGQRLIPYAEMMSATLADARKALAEEECMHINCATTPHAQTLFFDTALEHLNQKFPSMTIRHEMSSVENITRQLHEHSIDFGLTTSLLKSDDIECHSLLDVKLSLYESSADVLSQSDENRSDKLIHLEWSGSVTDAITKRLPDMKKAKIKTNAIEVVLNTMLGKPGVAVLPNAENPSLSHLVAKQISQFSLCQTPPLTDTKPSSNAIDLTVPVYFCHLKANKHIGLTDVLHTLRVLHS
jgi:DNA-binding transcriptional LysR family regulator